MLGEPHYTKLMHAEDVGTRLQHMADLHELWSTAYAILTRPNLYHTALEEERAKALEIALDLLVNHMEAEYNEVPYAKEINDNTNPPPMSIRPRHDPPSDFTTFRDTV
jgi:Cys-tRNA synthase (O-phospho-L-seryl-tRNA:Cys-tRNA synthase)